MRPSNFDVNALNVSPVCTTGVLFTICTEKSLYGGISFVTPTASGASFIVYDNTSTASGVIVDSNSADGSGGVLAYNRTLVIAKSGLVLSFSGAGGSTGAMASVFYVPLR